MVIGTGNFIPFFTAAQGNITYVTSTVTYTDAGAIAAIANILDGQMIQVKNITVSCPKGEVEKVDLHGVESTTTGAGVPSTGSFQNAIMDEKPWTNGKVTGTMILTLHNDGAATKLPDLLELATGTGQAISTTYHRHTFGDSTSSQKRNISGAFLVQYDNAVEQGTVLLNNPYVHFGDMKPTGGDGHWEVDFELTSFPKDFVLEVKDQD